MGWLDGITDSMDILLSKLRGLVKDREAWHATVYGVTRIQTQLSDDSPVPGNGIYSHRFNSLNVS